MADLELQTTEPNLVHGLNGQIVSCRIDRCDFKFFVTNGKDPIQNCHMRGCFFEPDELRLISRHLEPGSVVADIGANIGNHALFFEKLALARSTILFELNPDAINILKVNQVLNRCKNWDDQYLGYALSDKSGRMNKIVPDPNNLGATQFREDRDGTFQCIAGDIALSSRRVDFIKVDVEGGEMKVLEGLRETILRWRPTIFVELGNQYLHQFSPWLESVGYMIVDKFERYIGLPNYLIKAA